MSRPAGPRPADPAELIAEATKGNRAALARLLSQIERGGLQSETIARRSYRSPFPYAVGLTGAPGAGKSSLTDRLIAVARTGWPATGERPAASEAGPEPESIEQLAVLAVDPSSPFTGGAILGDRVRMQQHATDDAVFIRSMATRGHLGGLALAVPDAVRLLGAVGMALVLVETVGVGQMEVDIASAADTTIVVVTPGWGDSMQANKAGLLEVADLFVINKADRVGTAEARRDLDQMLDLSDLGDWRPPIVETVATTGDGVDALWSEVARHRSFLGEEDRLARRRADRLARELRRVVSARLAARVEDLSEGQDFTQAVDELAAGELDPYQAADRLLSAGTT